MSENESDLTLPERLEDLSLPSATAPLVSRAWTAVTKLEAEDFLIGFLLVPIAIAAGGMLAMTLLLTVTIFAPVLAAWLLWLAFRPAARNRRPPPVPRSTA